MTNQLTLDYAANDDWQPTLREIITENTNYYLNPHPPASYHLCDGSPLNRNDYPELFNLIGHKFGGEGDHFQLPNTGWQIRQAGTGDYIKVRHTPYNKTHIIGQVYTFYFRYSELPPQWYDPQL